MYSWMFTKKSNAIIYGLQLKAAQQMLDFDFLSGREPSVLAFINEWKNNSNHKIFFGDKEILIPSFSNFDKIPEYLMENSDTLVNFASYRSAWKSTKEAMNYTNFKNIVIIAEWIPERETREIIAMKNKINDSKTSLEWQRFINIIWPATVWAMSAWKFRAGNTGWDLENIIKTKLYKSWSVWFVSKSGWMSNELRRVIADRTDGTNLSIALGWDKYNILEFRDAFEIFEKDDETKIIVMLGEIGGEAELEIAEMIKIWKITKPVVAWCIGTIWNQLKSSEIQFGHAWAKSNWEKETANFKNSELKKAGAIVPDSYMDFGDKIEEVYEKVSPHSISTPGHSLLSFQDNSPCPKGREVTQKIDEKLQKIKHRKKTNFTSTISDERWEELTYNKTKISDFVKKGSFANVIVNLWLKKDLPSYWEDFINSILIILADHWPAVAGATNAIITARAWNDLKSSLIAGLTTIWPKFGWAIDWAAKYFFYWVKDWISEKDFVKSMKKSWINIPWIGHKVKSKFNPDKRCEILLELSKNFPIKKHLNFALNIEQITLEKKSNLILNVDWLIAALLLDLFTDLGLSEGEILEYIDAGIFNAFFILARTTGFIGHILDQKRLKEWLFRTPWEDILYN